MSGCVNVSTPQSVTPKNKARLAALIEDRAKQPGWTYQRIADEVDVNVVTLNAWRRGDYKNRPYSRTLSGLDRALGLADGSCEALLTTGAEPVPASIEDSDPAIARIRAMKHLSDEQKDLLISHLRDTRRSTLDRAEELNRRGQGKSA